MSKNLGEKIFFMGVDQASYERLLEIAKTQGKSVVDVTSEALQKHIENNQKLNESREKKLLMEG